MLPLFRLEELGRDGALAFLILLALAVFLKILAGSISLNGLLSGDRGDGSSYFSLGRAQLLLFTLIIAVQYLRQVAAEPHLNSLPDLPAGALEVLGGSQVAYLIGKARAFRVNSPNSFSKEGKGEEP